MLKFFEEALAVERTDGSPILELGGFHHGHQVPSRTVTEGYLTRT